MEVIVIARDRVLGVTLRLHKGEGGGEGSEGEGRGGEERGGKGKRGNDLTT